MSKTRKAQRPEAAAPELELLTDPQGAFALNVGLTRFLDLQKSDPDFPPPVWLGPRGKRHLRDALRSYAMSKRQRVAA